MERSFADAKQLHGHRYARVRGLRKVAEQCLLAATAQEDCSAGGALARAFTRLERLCKPAKLAPQKNERLARLLRYRLFTNSLCMKNKTPCSKTRGFVINLSPQSRAFFVAINLAEGTSITEGGVYYPNRIPT